MSATQTRTPAPILDLAAVWRRMPAGFSADDVQFLADESTAWQHVYLVPSKSQPGRLRRVVYSEQGRTWACSCPAQAGRCWHCAAARLAARVWWHRNVWRDYDDAMLAVQDARYAELLASGEGDEDDRVIWGSLGDCIAARRVS